MKQQKILIVGGFPPQDRKIFGGVVTSCKCLIASSFAERFSLVLVDSTQISNPAPGLAMRALLAVRRVVEYIGKLIFHDPEAVILFCSFGASVLEKGTMAWIARLKGVPVFIFPGHAKLIDIANESTFQHLWISSFLKGANYFLCQGPAWQRFATESLNFPIERAPIIPNWTATPTLLAIGEQRKPKAQGYVPQFLFLGWLEKEKGIFELLQACEALAQHYTFKLTVAGRGHAEQDARKFVRDKKLDKIVKFAGWVQGETRDNLLQQSDILVLPSWREGLPNAMIEAMAAKLAVIVSAVGNVPDMIIDQKEALLVPPQNVELLTQAMTRLLDDSVFLETLAERGYIFARENFALEVAVEKLTRVLKYELDGNLN